MPTSIPNENLKWNVSVHCVFQHTMYPYTLFFKPKCTQCTRSAKLMASHQRCPRRLIFENTIAARETF